MSKKEGESAEIIQKLTAELEQVKRDLSTTSTKQSLLEKELEEASRAKEAASQSGLQAKKDVIENFGELVESELQCSICKELFVCVSLSCFIIHGKSFSSTIFFSISFFLFYPILIYF